MAQKFTVPVTIKNLSSAGSDGITVFLDQESFARLKVEAGGRITWGAGAGAGDTNLYRDEANVLKTDDTFKSAGLFVAGTQIDPSGATVGDALVFNGTKFVSASVSSGTGNASLTVSDTLPVGAEAGDLWFESDTGKTFVYYDSFWVEIGNSGGGVVADSISGNAATATKLATARSIALTGDVTGTVSFDGSANASISTTIASNSVSLGTDTTGDYVQSLVAGTGVAVSNNSGEATTPTISIGQAVGTSASVQFAAVTAPLVGNASTASTLQNSRAISLNGDLSGSASFNGSSDVTITATVQPNSIALGADTTGNYMSGVSASTGVTVSHTPGEGSTATISLTGGPAFSAYPGTSQTVSSGGTLVKILFETEEFDTGSCFSSSRFTPTVAGYYQINSTVRLDGGGPGTGECMIAIFKNGGEARRGWNSSGTSFANDFFSMSVSGLVYCNGTTDYIEIYAQQVSGGNRTTSPYFNISYFQGYLARYA